MTSQRYLSDLDKYPDSMENPQILCSPFSRINADRESQRYLRRTQPQIATTSTHSSTPPIAVPAGPACWQHAARPISPAENDARPSHFDEAVLPTRQASRGRRASVTFDPSVKLCCGRETSLEGPLPHSGCSSPFSDSSPVGSEFGTSPSQAPGFVLPMRATRKRRVTAASKFLLSPANSEGIPEGVASLTSESTMSPMSEFHTPPASLLGSYFGNHRGAAATPVRSPSEYEARSPQDIPRNKSWSFGPTEHRPLRGRTFSQRSLSGLNSGSNGVSPASTFLSSFGAKSPSPQRTEPDSEGQEVGNHVLGKEIGHGGFSRVLEAFTIEDGVEVTHAVKIVRKRVSDNDVENDKAQAEFEHEVSLWRYLHHPNIMGLISVFDTPFATFAFMPMNRDGTLFELLKKKEHRQGLPADLARRYSFQLMCALRYLHEDMRIVHGDVKLENCLLDGDTVRLCDFGLAKFIKNPHDDSDDEDELQQQLPSFRPGSPETPPDSYYVTGSLQYAAPELIRLSAAAPADPAVDMWAFGVTLFALLTGALPFNHALQPKLADMILEGGWDVEMLRSRAPEEDVVEMVSRCLCMNSEQRWTVGEVLEQQWYVGLRE